MKTGEISATRLRNYVRDPQAAAIADQRPTIVVQGNLEDLEAQLRRGSLQYEQQLAAQGNWSRGVTLVKLVAGTTLATGLCNRVGGPLLFDNRQGFMLSGFDYPPAMAFREGLVGALVIQSAGLGIAFGAVTCIRKLGPRFGFSTEQVGTAAHRLYTGASKVALASVVLAAAVVGHWVTTGSVFLHANPAEHPGRFERFAPVGSPLVGLPVLLIGGLVAALVVVMVVGGAAHVVRTTAQICREAYHIGAGN